MFSRLYDCVKKWKSRNDSAAAINDEGEAFDLFFELRIIQIATNFFSDFNLLGRGGFGPVYKVLYFYFLFLFQFFVIKVKYLYYS